MGRQRQVWPIALADEMQGVQVKLCYPLTMRAIAERLTDVSCIGAIQIDITFTFNNNCSKRVLNLLLWSICLKVSTIIVYVQRVAAVKLLVVLVVEQAAVVSVAVLCP